MNKIILTVAGIYSMSLLVNAFSTGGPAGNTGSPNDGSTCASACHNTSNVGTVDIITDIPAEGYTPGEAYSITVTGSTASSQKYGFQAAVQNDQGAVIGEMDADGLTGTKFTSTSNKDYITHTAPVLASEGSWTFGWTAPTANTGDATIYCAMIAADGMGGSSGDEGLSGSLDVQEKVEVSTSVENNENSFKIYPNIVEESFFIENAMNKPFQIISSDGKLISAGLITSDKELISIDLKAGIFIVVVDGKSTKMIKQ